MLIHELLPTLLKKMYWLCNRDTQSCNNKSKVWCVYFRSLCECNYTRVALFWVSVHDDIRNCRHDLLDQTISQHGHSLMIILCASTTCALRLTTSLQITFIVRRSVHLFYLHLLLGDAAGSSQSNSQRGRDSAGTQPPLLPTPVLQRLQTNPGPATHVQRAHTCTYTHSQERLTLTVEYHKGH